jgi:hypothetical protein
MENLEAEWEAKLKNGPSTPRLGHCQETLIPLIPVMTAPVHWSLAWSEDGELAPQDLFDLLQTMVVSEGLEIQPSLVAAVERLSITHLSVMSASAGVTQLCA